MRKCETKKVTILLPSYQVDLARKVVENAKKEGVKDASLSDLIETALGVFIEMCKETAQAKMQNDTKEKEA